MAEARIPLATYRVQLRREFGFEALRERLPYLVALGITDVYVSPILQAVPGSTHGYDVVDPTRISSDLGGPAAFSRLVRDLRRLDLGLIVDIVPNHMGVADGMNPWWEDVLRHGRSSRYAAVFDIDWDAPEAELRGRVLLPILGDQPEAVIERAELTVEQTADGPVLRYFDRRLPLAPGTHAAVAAGAGPPDATAVRRLLDAQHYRLTYWREGKPRMNARRFFEIDTLIGVRQEDPEVFALTHGTILELVREGAVTGLRIDHVDGLADPQGYLDRLRAATAGDEDGLAIYTVVEKILGRDEALPESWAVHGTTGYDFLNEVNGLCVAREQEGEIVRAYRHFTGRQEQYLDIAYTARRAVIDGALAGRFDASIGRLRAAVASTIEEIAPGAFEEAMRALLASLPVYRTYHTAEMLDAAAPGVMHAAMAAARAADPRLDPAAVDAAQRVLAAPPEGEARTAAIALQQLMPAVAAKGLEDCALYRYVPLASANAVGGAPDQSSESLSRFHALRAEQHRLWPATMTTLATHDHKRGPDARARIDVISEFPEAWASAVERWHALTHAPGDGPASPSVHPHDEYTLYQTLAGSWSVGAEAGSEFTARIRAYAVKAAREAGERTTWLEPAAEAEAALEAFVERILDPERSAPFLDHLRRFVDVIAPAGVVNALAMLAIQMGAPGVPDTYQGRERWDFGLVDPDNRHPVDYDTHAAFLETVAGIEPGGRAAFAADLLARWQTGEVKQYALLRMLQARAASRTLFARGDYVALAAHGSRAEHVVAFARSLPHEAAIIVTPRLAAGLTRPGDPAWWAPDWDDTSITLPAGLPRRTYRDAFTDAEVRPSRGGRIRLSALLARFPIALLT